MGFGSGSLPSAKGEAHGRTRIGFGLLVATSTAKIVAVLRMIPAIVISASVIGTCCIVH